VLLGFVVLPPVNAVPVKVGLPEFVITTALLAKLEL